jgi:predicted TIM-barrel fold metal-dependent hydrolase
MQKLLTLILSILLFSATGCVNESNNEPEVGPVGSETLLLNNFRPESIFNVPVTNVEKARYPAIDMHAHTYAKYPDRFEVWCGIDFTDFEGPDFPGTAIAELERCYKKGAKGVGELGDKGKGFFFSKPDALGLHADDPRMGPIWDKCAELSMPVNIHVAEPKWMYEKMDSINDGLMNAFKWRLDNQPGIVNHQGMINILEGAVKNHPKTTFIACHVANCAYDLTIIAG